MSLLSSREAKAPFTDPLKQLVFGTIDIEDADVLCIHDSYFVCVIPQAKFWKGVSVLPHPWHDDQDKLGPLTVYQTSLADEVQVYHQQHFLKSFEASLMGVLW